MIWLFVVVVLVVNQFYLVAQIHQQHCLQEANDGHDHLHKKEKQSVTLKIRNYSLGKQLFSNNFSLKHLCFSLSKYLVKSQIQVCVIIIPVILFRLTCMAQTGAFLSTQKINSLTERSHTKTLCLCFRVKQAFLE